VKGHKLFTSYSGLTEPQLKAMHSFPAKSVAYNTGTNTYDFDRFAGKITDIDFYSVTFKLDAVHKMVSSPVAGDYVMLGDYFSDNREYAVRKVAGFTNNGTTGTITFNKPLSNQEFVYENMQQLIGMGIRVRSYTVFENNLRALIANFREAHAGARIGIMVNPLPNVGIRELWGYYELVGALADELKFDRIDISPFYAYQYSQKRDSSVHTVNATDLLTDSITGLKYADLSTVTSGTNAMNWEVLVNGKNVYGKDAVVYNSLYYKFDPALTGAALEMNISANQTKDRQVSASKPRLLFLKNAPASGTISLKYAGSRWSGDSCHIYDDDNGAKLYGEVYYSYLIKK
jgi:hypothetical protein